MLRTNVTRVPECQKIRKGWLDQYGAECFGKLIFATVRKSVGLKGLSSCRDISLQYCMLVIVATVGA